MLDPPVPVAVATSARELPVESGRWAYEPKLDGYRCCGFSTRRLLQSRQGNTALTGRFPEITTELATLGDVVVDGELIAVSGGRLTFSALQFGPARRAREDVTAILMIFDLLVREGQDLRGQPYLERRAILERLLADQLPQVQFLAHTLESEAETGLSRSTERFRVLR